MIRFTDHLKCLGVKTGQTFIQRYSVSASDEPFTRHIKTDGRRELVQKVRRNKQPGLIGTRQAQDKETLIVLTAIRDKEEGTKKNKCPWTGSVTKMSKYFLKMI